jgi:fibro-slime domain-containing protein
LPQTITGNYTNAVCRDLDLALDADGFWLSDISEKSPGGGFFPLDDFLFLDDAGTIPNPKYYLENKHNYSFTMRVQAEFKYIKGQYFEFRGDDDVWAFINNKLVVDIGGVHGPLQGSVNLDTLGLTEGEMYLFHIFFAERNMAGSNFKMRTSMDLRTERSYYPVKIMTDPIVVRYEVQQIVKTKGLQCDFSSSAQTDTINAPSNYYLTGPMFPEGPKTLVAGPNYTGIIIDPDFTGFSIDTAAMVRTRSLAPGVYSLRFEHSLDPKLSYTVQFTVPVYPLPSIVFTDSLWNAINSDIVKLGEWAAVPYPVHIEARYAGLRCIDCTEDLFFTTKDSLVFLDANNQPITGMKLDSGHATFWVMSLRAVNLAQFKVFGPKILDTLVWRNITLRDPPVPTQRLAEMHDRNGDGIGDSLIISYSRPLLGKDAPKFLEWSFGDSTRHPLDSFALSTRIFADSNLVLVGDPLVGFPFTGAKNGKSYAGSEISSFTYVPSDGADAGKQLPFQITGAIADKIGPVILTAEVGQGKMVDTLFLNISESMPSDSVDVKQLFELRITRAGVERAAEAKLFSGSSRFEGSRYILLFSNSVEVIPNVGDSIRLVPGKGYDVSGNVAHLANPLVRIVGRERAKVETLDLVNFTTEKAPPADAPTVRIVRVKAGQTIKDLVAQEGVPGHLIRYDLSNLILNSQVKIDPATVKLSYETWYHSNTGAYVNNARGSVKCTDSIFNGDCTKFPGNIFIGWNLRAKTGRLVSTGAYITELDFKVYSGTKRLTSSKTKQVWGIRRKK